MNNDTAILTLLADRQREIQALRDALDAAEAEVARVGKLLAEHSLPT